jgi:predicted RNA polymerase sigma factor
MRPGLIEDALRLGRILAGLVPGEPEVHGLVALMEIQASRAAARVGPSGEPVLLLDQDRARTAAETDWPGIAALYRELAGVSPSPVVELNRAVAVGMAFGPAAGLELVDRLAGEPALQGYHLLPSVRGDLLVKLGRLEEARGELERAASLATYGRERTLLLERAAACAGPPAR